MANLLLDHFSGVLNPRDQSPPTHPPAQPTHMITDVNIEANLVKEAVNTLNNTNACGDDKVRVQVLKKCLSVLLPSLTHLMKTVYDHSKEPKQWKHSTVIPLYKQKVNVADVKNYRPISLSSNLRKIMEYIVLKHIRTHCEEQQHLPASQHGFVPLRSCETALLEHTNLLYSAIEHNRPVYVIYLDQSSAFDKCSIDGITRGLHCLGIVGKTAKYVDDWLNGRLQSVLVEESRSTTRDVTSGEIGRAHV